MRDSDRIERILKLINRLWNQDLRFMQLMYNLQLEYSTDNSHYGRVCEEYMLGFDMFNLEDDKFEKWLINKVGKGEIK